MAERRGEERGDQKMSIWNGRRERNLNLFLTQFDFSTPFGKVVMVVDVQVWFGNGVVIHHTQPQVDVGPTIVQP